jgi:uncharacterized protein YndB with AHSA1/START domain
MSVHRKSAHLEAPIEVVWELVATPGRYPEWWPRVIEVRGERYEQGDEWAQVTHGPTGMVESNFLLERRDDLREIRMSCELTGTYAEWVLTEAGGGTFLELAMGMEPHRLSDRLFDLTAGRAFFRRWSSESLEALREAAGAEAGAAPS